MRCRFLHCFYGIYARRKRRAFRDGVALRIGDRVYIIGTEHCHLGIGCLFKGERNVLSLCILQSFSDGDTIGYGRRFRFRIQNRSYDIESCGDLRLRGYLIAGRIFDRIYIITVENLHLLKRCIFERKRNVLFRLVFLYFRDGKCRLRRTVILIFESNRHRSHSDSGIIRINDVIIRGVDRYISQRYRNGRLLLFAAPYDGIVFERNDRRRCGRHCRKRRFRGNAVCKGIRIPRLIHFAVGCAPCAECLTGGHFRCFGQCEGGCALGNLLGGRFFPYRIVDRHAVFDGGKRNIV